MGDKELIEKYIVFSYMFTSTDHEFCVRDKITGNNIDIGANGNILFTHGINIDSTDTTGITSMKLGLRNPQTGK